MIFVLERPAAAEPRAWFAYDAEDLLRKVAALDLPLLQRVHAMRSAVDGDEPLALATATLQARGDCRVFDSEAAAMAAFERADDPTWQGAGWRARWALREQLVALEVLADDL